MISWLGPHHVLLAQTNIFLIFLALDGTTIEHNCSPFVILRCLLYQDNFSRCPDQVFLTPKFDPFSISYLAISDTIFRDTTHFKYCRLAVVHLILWQTEEAGAP